MTVDEAPPVLLDWRLIEVAEVLAERYQVLIEEALISEQQYLVLEPCPTDRQEQALIQLP
jgi:hypothetical protein